MKILTLRQPFASAVLWSVGEKDIENRPMKTNIRGRIGIHAGKQWHVRALELDKKLPRGAVLGTVQIVGCHAAGAGCTAAGCYDNPWADTLTDGCGIAQREPPIWHWELDSPRRFVTPIRASGALGFWTPGPSVEHLMEIAEVEA